jgi:hypothetical protein
MLSVTHMPILQSVIMLSVVTLGVVVPSFQLEELSVFDTFQNKGACHGYRL